MSYLQRMLHLPHPSEPRRLPGWGGDGLELEEIGTTVSCGCEDPSLVFSSWDENVTNSGNSGEKRQEGNAAGRRVQGQERCRSLESWVHHHVMLTRRFSLRVWADLSVNAIRSADLALAPSDSNRLQAQEERVTIPEVAFEVGRGLTSAGKKDMLVL